MKSREVIISAINATVVNFRNFRVMYEMLKVLEIGRIVGIVRAGITSNLLSLLAHVV
jgi:hypothetical protein